MGVVGLWVAEWRLEIDLRWHGQILVQYMASEPLHWLSYGNGWELAGSGIVGAMQPSSTHDCFPRRPSLALCTAGASSSPRRLSGGLLLQPVRGWVYDAEVVGGDGGGGGDGGWWWEWLWLWLWLWWW